VVYRDATPVASAAPARRTAVQALEVIDIVGGPAD
jgi:hypothetical protein